MDCGDANHGLIGFVMSFRLSPSTVAVATALSFWGLHASAQETVSEPVLVSATRIDMQDTDAPYASEVHTREQISRSGAHSLFDYLSQQSSLQITPQWGNRHAPNVTMRGFGEDGHQNVVITVNGRRLNNIDNVPALIGAISLRDIERIEITKGSGAVMYGDGATAGSIQIYTKAQNAASLDIYGGSHGQRGAVASLGLVKDRFDLSVTADHSKTGGFSATDSTGHKDAGEANTWRVAGTVKLTNDMQAEVELGASRIDNRFPNGLTAEAFADHPGQSNGLPYPRQVADNQYWGLGLQYQLQPHWKLHARHHREDKESSYDSFTYAGYTNEYQQQSNEIALQFQQDAWVLNAGVQSHEGERWSFGSLMRKDHLGGFIHAQYMLEDLTLAAGLRRERVRYHHSSAWQAGSSQQEYLTSWELGVNQRLSEQLSVFANYSDAFATPDIDRFFDYNTNRFTGFGEATKSRSFTLGLNHTGNSHRLKASAFYARLHDEIYFDPMSGLNGNLEQSHKYGIEVHNQWQLSPRQQLSVNYAWTRAKIDKESQGGSDYGDKQVPGVPRHSVTLGWNLRVADKGHLQLSHTWRSSHWAIGNFGNDPAFRQATYSATDVSYRHQLHRHIELYAAVHNLFDQANSVAVKNWQYVLYPSNFERSFKLGARISF